MRKEQTFLSRHSWGWMTLPKRGKSPVSGIVFVEKMSIFRALYDIDIFTRDGLILAVGPGFPTTRMRRELQNLMFFYRCPAYILTDNDPAGLELYACVCSDNLIGKSKHTISNAYYLGLRTHDIDHYGIDRDLGLELQSRAVTQLERLRTLPFVRSSKMWMAEVDTILKNGVTFELEVLTTVLSLDVYIRDKIARSDWLLYESD